MITVKFFTEGRIYSGFEFSGHSGLAPAGEDILCASVSSAVILTANTITDFFKIPSRVTQRDGYLKLVLLKKDPDSAQKLIESLAYQMKTLSSDYPGEIKIKIRRK